MTIVLRSWSLRDSAAMDAILLPGGILPAQLAYDALLRAFGAEVDARANELEVYSADEVPPSGYGMNTEVAGIDRLADEAGSERFHLVGYSAGGASSLAYALTRGDRLLSLTLAEPAWAGVEGRTPEEEAATDRVLTAIDLPPDEMLPAFMRAQLAHDVERPRRHPVRHPRGWRAARPGPERSLPRSSGSSSRPPTCRRSNPRSCSCWVNEAIPRTTGAWPSVSRRRSRTSASRCSTDDTTSIHPTGPSPSGTRGSTGPLAPGGGPVTVNERGTHGRSSDTAPAPRRTSCGRSPRTRGARLGEAGEPSAPTPRPDGRGRGVPPAPAPVG